MQDGFFPCELKTGRISPIYKKEDEQLLENYRPVSTLPVFGKIFEKIIYSRLYSFLISKGVINENQFGFRKGHSTSNALNYSVEHIESLLAKKQHVLGIFIDLSKAFDTIDHRKLTTKLEHYGIRGNALQLISSYLSNRKQYVNVLDIKSDELPVHYGVPQGSVLGPLLFILYINDICNISTDAKLVLFADDTNIFVAAESISKVYEIANKCKVPCNPSGRATTQSYRRSVRKLWLHGPRKIAAAVQSVNNKEERSANIVVFGVTEDENEELEPKEVALSSSKNDCVENRAVREIIKEELQLFAPKLTKSLNDVINGSTEKTVNKAVHLYSEVTAKSQKKVIEDLSTAQASENVISKVQTKMHTDAYERNLRKLNLCVVKVPESNKATSKQRQEDDAKFCLETLKIEKRDFISCHRAGKPDPKKPDYCRPLIIKTADEESVNYYSNHGKGWKESSYWINLDLCRADREIRFLARKERKKRQDGAAQKNLLKNP
ncbi:hypothetical protein ACHWQZ_G006407 [Mnemiopsis leidyi]